MLSERRMEEGYRADVAIRLYSPAEACFDLTINGGFDLKQKFDPLIDVLWIKVTQPISDSQFVDIDYKVLRRKDRTVCEGTTQYRDYRYEGGVEIRCDNFDAPRSLHLEKVVNISKRSKKEWKKLLPIDPQIYSPINAFRLTLHNVLQYVERHYDPYIAPKFYFPMSQWFNLNIPQLLSELKPDHMPLSRYSEILSFITAHEIRGTGVRSWKKWVNDTLLPTTNRIEEAIRKEEPIIVTGVQTLFPVPIFGPPKSKYRGELYLPRPMRVDLRPVGFVFERKKQGASEQGQN